MKVNVYYYISNCGDGSCAVHFFNSEQDAEDYASQDGERFCEDIKSKTLEFDKDGRLLNEPPIRY